MARLHLQGGQIGVDGFGNAALGSPDHAEVVPGFGKARIQAHGALVFGGRLIAMAQTLENHTQVEMGPGEAGVDRECGAVVALGALQMPPGLLGDAQVVVGIRILGPQMQGATKGKKCIF